MILFVSGSFAIAVLAPALVAIFGLVWPASKSNAIGAANALAAKLAAKTAAIYFRYDMMLIP